MPINYKDINELTEQTTIAGTEKVPVSGTKYVLFNKIKDWIISSLKTTGLDLGGKQIKNVAIEVVTSLPATGNFTGRQVTYQGKSYIWDGGSWVTPNNVYEANLIWGGRNISGGYSPIDAAMVDELGANRLAFANPAGITIEYSTDGGATWLDYGASDSAKNLLTASLTGLVTGKSTSNLTASPLNMLRVTFDTGVCQVYTILNKIVIYGSTSGSLGSYVTIQKALQSTPNNYINHVTNVPISGWPGYNVINIPNLTTYGNSPTVQYGRLRFIFGCTGYNGTSSSHTGLNIGGIKGFGGVGWTAPSNMAKRNSLFTYDGFQNAYFPGLVRSNESINFDTITEPNETGTKTKTSTTLWQNLFAHINFLWLKLKGLFSAGSATTNNNYLPKIDDVNKKLVKSNISDDGTTPKYGANKIWHSGNDGSSSGLEADLLDGKHATAFATSTHNHDYNLLANLPDIYNAHHEEVPTDDFDELFSYENDVWLCSHSMYNAPLDDEGNINTSDNSTFKNCVIQQFGSKDTNTKVQVLYITTGDVTNLSMGYIFYRIQGDKWKRIATYSDIAGLQSLINNLENILNSKLDQMSETTVTPTSSYSSRHPVYPKANNTLYINCPTVQNLYVHIYFFNSLEESVIIVNNNGATGIIDVTFDADYKVAGMVPFFTAGSKWVISIFKGILFFNQLN